MTRRRREPSRPVELGVAVGPITLRSPIVAASGTFGHGDEVARVCDPRRLGAVTAKSQAPFAWPGNPAPRLHPAPAGMLNAVGLQGRGVEHWVAHDLPALRATGAAVIASIWGRSTEDFERAAEMLVPAREELLAVECNLSCPNVHHHAEMFAHDPAATADAVAAVVAAGLELPLLAKLSPNVAHVVDVARAAVDAGATGLTLVNTVLGAGIDAEARRSVLGREVGGLSGPAIKPIALRIVHEVSAALPDVPIVGTGGVSTGLDAIEMLLAGASAVGVGTATFAEPRATLRILDELVAWCADHGVDRVADLTGALEARP